MTETTYADRMRAKLIAAFAPERLEIEDQSESHRGHGGYREGGQTHFHIVIRAAAFDGQSRVARQRMINKVVADELAERVHALSMTVLGAQEG
ncbi:MAG: BolA protein [Paracoccaceae bacterium]|jgi:BolA protein